METAKQNKQQKKSKKYSTSEIRNDSLAYDGDVIMEMNISG